MDVFRSIHPNIMAMGGEPRISTSNLYYTKEKPNKMARLRGLNKLYYNMVINAHSSDENEVRMLQKLKECTMGWSHLLQIQDNFSDDHK